MSGHFITFEGGEGAGKSTQIARLKAFLEKNGKSVVVTREPGGSPGAEKIRSLLLSGGAKDQGPHAEAMLFAAARADHVDATIKPALDRGDWVLCDRYSDSTRVYQGEAGVEQDYLKLLELAAVAGLRPDMTLLIDVPPKIGLSRVAKRSETDDSGGPDRFEDEAVAVHERRRKMFLQLALDEAYRFTIIDGSRDEDFVEREVRKSVVTTFPEEFDIDAADMATADRPF